MIKRVNQKANLYQLFWIQSADTLIFSKMFNKNPKAMSREKKKSTATVSKKGPSEYQKEKAMASHIRVKPHWSSNANTDAHKSSTNDRQGNKQSNKYWYFTNI